MSTLHDLLVQSTANHPHKTAVVIPDEFELTYTQFSAEVEKVKTVLLKQGELLLLVRKFC